MNYTKHYKPNCAYILELEGLGTYIGCHTSKDPYLTEIKIIMSSGNPLKLKLNYGQYKSRATLKEVFEYDTPEEALNKEEELIQQYGDKCINKGLGNRYGRRGVPHTEEWKKRMSNIHKGHPFYGNENCWSEEANRKRSEKLRGKKEFCKPILQYSLEGDFIREWEGARPCARELSKSFRVNEGTMRSNICRCLSGGAKSSYGYVWKYK